jgi:hypothetical protein
MRVKGRLTFPGVDGKLSCIEGGIYNMNYIVLAGKLANLVQPVP